MTGNGKGWARGYRHESLTCANCGKPRGQHLPDLYHVGHAPHCPRPYTGHTTFLPVVFSATRKAP